MLVWASSLLCGCHNLVRHRVCSPVVGVEVPTFGSQLRREVSGTGALLLGKELLHIPPQGLPTGDVRFCVTPPTTLFVGQQSPLLLDLPLNSAPMSAPPPMHEPSQSPPQLGVPP